MADSTTLIAHKGARIVTREQASTDAHIGFQSLM
jgi:hypothetical protein